MSVAAIALVVSLIVFMAIDYISGVMLAIVNKEVSSAVGARGIFKKMMIMQLDKVKCCKRQLFSSICLMKEFRF